jgi:hypothetical protein
VEAPDDLDALAGLAIEDQIRSEIGRPQALRELRPRRADARPSGEKPKAKSKLIDQFDRGVRVVLSYV